jgi:hypothetical protein
VASGTTFEDHARIALGMYGIEVDETDLAVMESLYAIYGALQDELLSTSFADVPPEANLDPSGPPEEAAA